MYRPNIDKHFRFSLFLTPTNSHSYFFVYRSDQEQTLALSTAGDKMTSLSHEPWNFLRLIYVLFLVSFLSISDGTFNYSTFMSRAYAQGENTVVAPQKESNDALMDAEQDVSPAPNSSAQQTTQEPSEDSDSRPSRNEEKKDELPSPRDESDNKANSDKDESQNESEIPSSPTQPSNSEVLILKQKNCVLVIQGDKSRVNQLKTGDILAIQVEKDLISVRINRKKNNRVRASLRKNDCSKKLNRKRGIIANSITKPQIPEGKFSSNDRPQAYGVSNENTFRQTIRKRPNGVQALAGFYTLGVKSSDAESVSSKELQISYEWLEPESKPSREISSGMIYGLGLALYGFRENDERDSFEVDVFNGHAVFRLGYRWQVDHLGIALAPTFDYFLFYKRKNKSEFFPDESVHFVGMEAQIDYEIGDSVNLVSKFNYMLFPIGSEEAKIFENIFVFRSLFGVWWLI